MVVNIKDVKGRIRRVRTNERTIVDISIVKTMGPTSSRLTLLPRTQHVLHRYRNCCHVPKSSPSHLLQIPSPGLHLKSEHSPLIANCKLTNQSEYCQSFLIAGCVCFSAFLSLSLPLSYVALGTIPYHRHCHCHSHIIKPALLGSSPLSLSLLLPSPLL